MYLERGGSVVIGAFYDTSDWLPVILAGRWQSGGEIEAGGQTEEKAGTGVLKARLTAGTLVGTWVPNPLAAPLPVRLATVPRPDCGGSGPWQRFDDNRWPIAFLYPASWHARVTSSRITLTCPDPSLMPYAGFEIDLARVRPGTLGVLGFVQCGGTWRYGPLCDCAGSSGCEAPADSEIQGIRVIVHEGAARTYCRGGGYVAAGSGLLGILLSGDERIQISGQGPPSELIRRILGTLHPRR